MQGIGQGDGIPCGGAESPGKVAKCIDSASRTEKRSGDVTRQWIEPGTDPDRHGTRDEPSPDIRRTLESDEPLLAEGGAWIPADRRDRRRIIETLTGAVIVDHPDDGCLHGWSGNGPHPEKRACHQEDAQRVLVEHHRLYFPL